VGRDAVATFQAAIRRGYGCESTFVEAVPVTETVEGSTAWSGLVHVFDLHAHPTSSRCYAWSLLRDEVSGSQRIETVLHGGPVDSPRAAVQASIVKAYGESTADYPDEPV
jgi:hypothetical protein